MQLRTSHKSQVTSHKQNISVIIPTYHSWKQLQLCLNALKRQTYHHNKFEIIVVNNDTKDKIPSDFVLPENCTIIEEEKPGSYAARNKGITIARGEIYAFTDADCQPQADWLEVAMQFFQQNPNCARIGGKVALLHTGKKVTPVEAYEKIFAFRQKETVAEQGAAITANMIAKSYIFNHIGKFNDNMLSGGDIEWGKRANTQNHKIEYLEKCVVWHPARATFFEITKKTRRIAGGQFYLQKRKGIRFTLSDIIIGTFPPIRSTLTVLSRRKDITLYDRALACTVRYYLKIISSHEKIRLLLGKQPERS